MPCSRLSTWGCSAALNTRTDADFRFLGETEMVSAWLEPRMRLGPGGPLAAGDESYGRADGAYPLESWFRYVMPAVS